MRQPIWNQRSEGYALLMVMVTTAVGLTVASAFLKWSSTKESLNERAKEYRGKLEVAEASTETFYSYLSKDFLTEGKTKVDQSIWQYSSWYTTGYGLLNVQLEEDSADLAFSQELLNNNWTFGTKITNWSYGPLATSPEGLYGEAATFRVYSYGRKTGNSYLLVKNIEQDIQCASVPVFQFGIFYLNDLEMSPGSDINTGQTILGRVHSNGDMYLRPSGRVLQFEDPVTCSGAINNTYHPDDPRTATPTENISYNDEKLTQVKSYVFPVGETSTPNAAHALIEKPPVTESPSSVLGKIRMYNKADMIIEVYDSNVIRGFSGAYNNFDTQIPMSTIEDIVSTSNFFNRREYRDANCTDIDMEEFLDKYSSLKSILGRDIRILYIADLRTKPGCQSGVRLLKGRILPSTGLTIATMNPLYVEGNYNVGNGGTSPVVSASLMGDAITILSGNWSDSNGIRSLSHRQASTTRVNAAMIGGVVPSGGGFYSGGMENFARLLEDWGGTTLQINGSFVVLFKSETATA